MQAAWPLLYLHVPRDIDSAGGALKSPRW